VEQLICWQCSVSFRDRWWCHVMSWWSKDELP